MKKITALLLALALTAALAGCIKDGGGTAPADSTDGGTQPPATDKGTTPPADSGEETNPVTPPDSAEPTKPETPPADTDPDALKLGLMSDAAALGAAGLYGGTYTLVTNVKDPGRDLASGALDAAIVPVDTAARIYVETDGKLQIAAVTAKGGWGIIERGNTVHDIWGLASKTVYAAREYPGALELFAYIAEQYDFIIGDTLKLESVPLSELAEHDLTLMPAALVGEVLVRDAGTRMALDVGQEWTEITNTAFLPAACLVVGESVTDGELTDLLAALKASQETISDNLESAVALGLAENQEEAWASVEYLDFMWLEGADTIREELLDYFTVLVSIDPELIGGHIPDDGFYR